METSTEKYRVLLIDDDKKLCRLLKEYLEPMGYVIDLAHTGPDGLERVKAGEHHAVILDVMLPGMDGFEVLKKLRAFSKVPVLMLTSRGDETDRIVGLEVGADDYLPKTFSTRELLARLRAVIRRAYSAGTAEPAELQNNIEVGDLRISAAARQAYLKGEELKLTPVEYDLLLSLASNAGRVMSREMLLDSVAGRDYEVFDRSIDVHVSALRRKLDDDPKEPRYIKSVRAVGYLFIKAGEGKAET